MTYRWRVTLILVLIGSCSAVVRGDVHCSARCFRQKVYVFRGFLGYWPEAFGMGSRMSNRGYSPQVYRSREVPRVMTELLENAGQGTQGPVYLIGYSYGASAAVTLARNLQQHGICVDRMVLIECYDHPEIPANVRYCVNIYETRRLDRVQPFRGTPARAADPASTQLIDIDVAYHPEWEDVRENNHFNMADDPRIQGFAAQQFPDLMPPVKTTAQGSAISSFRVMRREPFDIPGNLSATTAEPPRNHHLNLSDQRGSQGLDNQSLPNVMQSASNNVALINESAAIYQPLSPGPAAVRPSQQVWAQSNPSPGANYRTTSAYRPALPEPRAVQRNVPYTSYRAATHP